MVVVLVLGRVSKFSLHPDEYLGRLKPKAWVQIHSLTLQVTLPKSVDRKNEFTDILLPRSVWNSKCREKKYSQTPMLRTFDSLNLLK